jgi:hypothetical protein
MVPADVIDVIMHAAEDPPPASRRPTNIALRAALAASLLLQLGCTAVAVTGAVVGATIGAGAAVVGTAVSAGVGAGKAVVGAMTSDEKSAATTEPPAPAGPTGSPVDPPAY